MTDTATLNSTNGNGTLTGATAKTKGIKRPANRFIGASNSALAEAKVSLGIEATPTSWKDLPINTTFSKSQSGIPLCVKVSVSAYVEVFSSRRESGIAGGEVFRVVQK